MEEEPRIFTDEHGFKTGKDKVVCHSPKLLIRVIRIIRG
jgi:hypothetical protein